MIVNMRRTIKPIEITGIGREPTRVHHEGDLMGYGTVYYHREVTAKIFSLSW